MSRTSVSAVRPEGGDAPRGERAQRILIVDDLPEMCHFLAGVLREIREPPVRVETDFVPERALGRVQREAFDLVISDLRLRGVNGVDLLHAAHKRNPDGLRILLTAYDETQRTDDQVRAAAIDVTLRKPVPSQELRLLIEKYLRAEPEQRAHWRSEQQGPLGRILTADDLAARVRA